MSTHQSGHIEQLKMVFEEQPLDKPVSLLIKVSLFEIETHRFYINMLGYPLIYRIAIYAFVLGPRTNSGG